jgi:Lipocalin-like domain
MFSTFETSWNQMWTGTTQKRNVEIVGNRLIVTSDPVKATATGLDIVFTNVLERIE